MSSAAPGTARSLRVGLPILFFACLLAFAIHRIFGYDVWWQIRTGDWILNNGLPTVDPFSYAFPRQPWIEPRWLYCLTVYAVSGLGLNFLILFKALLLAVTFGLLARIAGNRAPWAGWFGATMALAIAGERFLVRPELVSFLGIALTLLCLERYRSGESRRMIWILPAWQVAWCNAHTLWILGPAVQWIFVVGLWLDGRLRRDQAPIRPLILVAGLSSIATLLNPYGIDGALFPFQLFRQIGSAHFLGGAIEEFNSPFASLWLNSDYRTLSYLVVIVLSAASFGLRGRHCSIPRLALWLAFLYLSVRAQRNVALFGIVAGAMTSLNLADGSEEPDASPGRLVRRLATGLAFLFLLVMTPLLATDGFYRSQGSSKQFGFGVSERRFPIAAMAFVRHENLPTPVLNTLGDGGYVLFEGGPGSVFIDGRLEVYGSENLEQALPPTQTGIGLTRLADRLGVETVLVRNQFKHRELSRCLEESADWFPVYFDALHLIYVRASPKNLRQFLPLIVDWHETPTRHVDAPAGMDPPDWLEGLWPRVADNFEPERLGSLFVSVASYDRALEQFEIAVDRRPGDSRANLFLGLFYDASGREAEAERLFSRVPRHEMERHDVDVLAGEIFMGARKPGRAVEKFQRAMERNGGDRTTALRLARAAIADASYDLASATLDQLLESDPTDLEALNLNAVRAMRMDRLEEAIELFERSVGLAPDQLRVRQLLATAYAESGRTEQAREQFEHVLRMDPDNSVANAGLLDLNR